MTEDETVGQHHRLDGHGFGWTPGVGDRQGGLACCGSWGCKESDTTERLNLTKLKGPLEMPLNLGLQQGDYKMILEHLVMTESKKVAKKIEQKETKTKKCLGISQKDFGFLSLLAGWR